MSELPEITLLVAGNQDIEEQSYPNIKLIRQDIDTPGKFFNEHTADGLYGYLSSGDNFTNKLAVEKIVKYLMYNDMVSGVYCDSVVKTRLGYKEQFMPAFHPNLIHSPLLFNVPLFFKHPVQFNPALKYMCFYQVWRSLINRMLFLHIPEILIKTEQSESPDIINEIQQIKNTYAT